MHDLNIYLVIVVTEIILLMNSTIEIQNNVLEYIQKSIYIHALLSDINLLLFSANSDIETLPRCFMNFAIDSSSSCKTNIKNILV